MLAERRHAAERRTLAVDDRRRRQDLDGSAGRFDRQDAGAAMPDQAFDRRDLAIGDAGTIERGGNVREAALSQGGLETGVERLAVLNAADVEIEARIGGERSVVEHLGAEALPFALALDGDYDVAVAQAEGAIGRDRRVCETEPSGLAAAIAPPEIRHGPDVGDRVDERQLDARADAGARSPEHRL